MRNIWAICKREFASYFITPIGYVAVGTFAAVSGLGFAASFLFYAKVSVNPQGYAYATVPGFEETLLSPFLVFCGMMIMFIGPLVTMRLLAGERYSGTMELLLTHPIRDREIVFGKYLAALGMLLAMMGFVGVDLLIVFHYVTVEPIVLVFGVLTVFLMGAAIMSMGLFISAMCRNPMTAGILTFGLSLVLYTVGSLSENLTKKNPTPETWPESLRNAVGVAYDLVRNLLQQLTMDAHAKEMAQGIFQPKDVAYYVLVAAFFLFLTFRALESRKWRA